MLKVRLMLPAYNEEHSLPALLNRVKELQQSNAIDLEVLLVNDGSTDDTLRIAKENQLKVIDLQPNQGLAAAMRNGITSSIKDLTEDFILITMDADDSHHPNLIPEMVRKIEKGADIVIASRYQKGSKVIGLSKFRVFLTQGAGVLYKLFSPVKGVKDYTCGYRAYRLSLLTEMSRFYGDAMIEQNGFACMGEILLKSRRFNPKIEEVAMVLRYDRKKSDSKMNVFHSIRQTLQLIFSTKQ